MGSTKTHTHHTGYHVWTYGKKSWHRTRTGAHREAVLAERWCSDVNIVSCETGNEVSNEELEQALGY